MSWYEENIEDPLKRFVRYLRNNGINTECSCGHELYVQCQFIPDGRLKEVHDLVYNFLFENKFPIDFEINISHRVDAGHCYTSMDIKLPEGLGKGEKQNGK